MGLIDPDSPINDFLEAYETIDEALQVANTFGITLPDELAQYSALAPYTATGSVASSLVAANVGLTSAVPGSQAWLLAEQVAEFGEEGLQATVEALGADATGNIGSFLKTPVGGGIAAAVLTGALTGDWKTGAWVGVGTAIGNIMLPGIGGIVGGIFGSMFSGGAKPSRPRYLMDYNPREDDATARANSGGSFYGEAYPDAAYTRTYTSAQMGPIEQFIEQQGKATEKLLASLGLEETTKRFQFGTRQGTVYIAGGDVNPLLSGTTVQNTDGGNRRFFGQYGGRDTMPEKETWMMGLQELQEEVLRSSALEFGTEAMQRYARTFIGDTKELVLGLAKVKAMTPEEADAWLTQLEDQQFSTQIADIEASINKAASSAQSAATTWAGSNNYYDNTIFGTPQSNLSSEYNQSVREAQRLSAQRNALADFYGKEIDPYSYNTGHFMTDEEKAWYDLEQSGQYIG